MPRVRALRHFVASGEHQLAYMPGDVLDVDRDHAKRLIESGLAEPVVDEPEAATEPAPPEAAVLLRPRRR
jgi:hypothetical protein